MYPRGKKLAQPKSLEGKRQRVQRLVLVLGIVMCTMLLHLRQTIQVENGQDDPYPYPQHKNKSGRQQKSSMSSDFPLEWMASFHDSMFQFSRYQNFSISSFGLNKAYESLTHGLIIRVENNAVYAKSKTLYKTSWESNFKNGIPEEFFCRIYHVLCSLEENNNIDIVFNHADEPIGDIYRPYPAFSWVKSELSTDFLVPYGDAWGGKLDINSDSCARNNSFDSISWEKKIRKGVWRGANTGMTLKNWKTSPRAQLVMLCNIRPDLCDAGITEYLNGSKEQIEEMKDALGTANTLSRYEQERFKYAIVSDGNSAPSSRMRNHLESTSLIMKQTSKFKEFFYDSLIPYVHFIPLKSDFRDLAQKLSWIKENDELAYSIMQNARKFSCRWLNSRAIHSYTSRVFKEYLEKFEGIQATDVKTSEMIRVKIESLKDLEMTCGISPNDLNDGSCKILTGL